jgi:hypothetical protein
MDVYNFGVTAVYDSNRGNQHLFRFCTKISVFWKKLRSFVTFFPDIV